MIPPRQREAEAILVLVDLIQNVDEWSEEHHDTAQLAAREAAAWLRRAKVGQDAPEKPKRKVGGRKPTGKPSGANGDIPADIRAAVAMRSKGRCEARTEACEGAATQIHHIAGRGWLGCHDPRLLLHVCGLGNATGCHGWIHQDRPRAEAAGFLSKWSGPRMEIT